MSSLAILLKIASRITDLNRSLSLGDRSWRSTPLALFLSKCIRLLLIQFSKNDWLVSPSKHTESSICFDEITSSPVGKCGTLVRTSTKRESNQCHLISNDRIFVISLVSIRPRKTSSTIIL